MKRTTAKAGIKAHAIQLVSLGVRELSITANVPPDIEIGTDVNRCSIRIGNTDYDMEGKRIAVTLRLESGTGPDEAEAPFTMKIEVRGLFHVDDTKFPVEHISDWASKSAPYVLFPFLREHAFGLSSRCGFRPMLLPLFEVPTYKIEKVAPTKKKPK